MEKLYYVGMDIHKRTISIAVKDEMGYLVDQTKIKSNREILRLWCAGAPSPFIAVIEATMFTGWVYDELIKYAKEVKVANPLLLHFISKGKKKSDPLDAAKLADLLRVNLIPEVYMLPKEVRRMRNLLRYRNWLVAQCTRHKNKISGQLMMQGIEYNSHKLHYKRYFQDFLQNLELEDDLIQILRISRAQLELLQRFERDVKKLIFIHPEIAARVELLMSIPGVGEITALSWILEVWDPHRFSSYKDAISYCGLCSSYKESGGKEKTGPISKQRNKRIQWVLVEASRIAVHRIKNPELLTVYEKTASRKNKNAAVIAVARHMVKWLMAVDKRGTPFTEAA